MSQKTVRVKQNPLVKYGSGLLVTDEAYFGNLARGRRLKLFRDRAQDILFVEGPVRECGMDYEMAGIIRARDGKPALRK